MPFVFIHDTSLLDPEVSAETDFVSLAQVLPNSLSQLDQVLLQYLLSTLALAMEGSNVLCLTALDGGCLLIPLLLLSLEPGDQVRHVLGQLAVDVHGQLITFSLAHHRLALSSG